MKTQALHMQTTHVMEDYADKIAELQNLIRENLNSQITEDTTSFEIVLIYKYEDHVQFIAKDEVFDYESNELEFLSVNDEIDIYKSFDQVLQTYEQNGWEIVPQDIPRTWFQKFFGYRQKTLLTFTLTD